MVNMPQLLLVENIFRSNSANKFDLSEFVSSRAEHVDYNFVFFFVFSPKTK